MAKVNINIEDLILHSEELNDNMKYFESIGRPLLDEYSKDLDEKVTAVKNYLNRIKEYNLDFDPPSIQKALLDLTTSIFFTTEKLEKIGWLEDVSKLQYQTAYNNAYLEKQGSEAAGGAGGKYSVQQLKAYADQVALSDNVLNFIYARCSKILKDKVDQANDVAKALSKILSYQVASINTFNYAQKHM